jgi:hypothetical protein
MATPINSLRRAREALAHEIGIFGGRSSPDGISLTYQAGGLKIWISWEIGNTREQPPTFMRQNQFSPSRTSPSATSAAGSALARLLLISLHSTAKPR